MADTSGFVFEKDEKLEYPHLLKISPEYTTLEKVLNSSGLLGHCKLTLLPEIKCKWGSGPRCTVTDYSLDEQQIRLEIYNLNSDSNILEIFDMFETMNIPVSNKGLYVRKLNLTINNLIEDISYYEYEYLTEAGSKIADILQKEGIADCGLKDLSSKLVFLSEQEMKGFTLVQRHVRRKTIGRGNYSLNVSWPHDATKGFLPILEIILKRLVKEKMTISY